MQKHDPQATNNDTATPHFNGEEIEFAPFMFEASPETAQTSQGTFSGADVEFEPFMFDQGEAFNVPSQAAPVEQGAPAPFGTNEPATPDAPVMPFVPDQPVAADAFVPTPAPETPQPAFPQPDTTVAPFAGHEVPVPSYLQSAPSDIPAMPVESTAPATPATPAAPAVGQMPAPVAPAAPATGPMHETGPISAAPTPAAPAPTPVPVTPTAPAAPIAAAPPSGSMPGRTRGSTGPLGATLPNASWSDSSLASIEDFSSVLIAMYAGKRMRQSGPLNESMVARQPSPVNNAMAGQPLSAPVATMQPEAQPQWAANAMAAGTAVAAAMMQPDQSTPAYSQPEWANLPPDNAATASQATQPDMQPTPSWNMNETPQPQADSWAGAQPQGSPAPVPVSDAALSAKAMTELAAIRSLSGDDTPGGLEPGVADILKTMDPVLTEGSGQGAELEFEGFMFNEGTPAPLPVLPVMDAAAMSNLPQEAGPAFDPQAYANAAPPEETHEYGDLEGEDFGQPSFASIVGTAPGSLPFWLQDQTQTPQGEAGMQAQPSWSAQDTLTPDSAVTNDDFADLPPIDPFDFSLVTEGEDDSEFGFDVDELIGLMPEGRDPMVVTANLEALADLMTGPGGNPFEPKSRNTGPVNAAMIPPATDTGLNQQPSQDLDFEPQAVPVEPMQGDGDTTDDSKPVGWMATVTSGLTMDKLSSLTGNLENSASNAEMVVEDLDIAPFDYAELDLDVEEETPTSNLMSGALQGERTSRLDTTTGQAGDTKAATPATDKSTGEAGGDTSFMPQPPAEAQAAESQEMPTGYLNDETHLPPLPDTAPSSAPERSGTLQPFNTADMASLKSDNTTEAFEQPPTTNLEPTEQEPTVVKARVASSAWADAPVAPVAAVAAVAGATEPQATPEQPAGDTASDYGVGVRKAARTKVLNPEVAAQLGGSQAPAEENYVPKMPMPGDITTSGPLPSLDGFEDLSAWIERYPQDMGAHMALASAYTQAGDIDTALRVYRRMLRKPNVSENVLRMVQDELSDLEDQAQQYPRYYQVRGDLLVRQGHRREAIEEYNKLG